jgi:hypothetical protein
MRSRIRFIARAGVLGALAGLGGCLIVPVPTAPVHEISVSQRLAIKIGETRRSDILMTYGAPELRLEDDRVFVYAWSRERAAMVVGYAAGALRDREALFIAFGADGRVMQTGTATAWSDKTIADMAEAWAKALK